jgi:5'-nucleotidase
MVRGQRMVFFDVGNVLIDEDPFLAEALRLIHRAVPSDHPKAQLERFWGDVERALKADRHTAVESMGFRCFRGRWLKLRKEIQQQIDRRWWSLARMIPGSRPVLESLRENFRLGIIANQPAQVVECLEGGDLLPLFDVVLLDSQQGLAKPDLAFFRIALEKARIDPPEGLMVGDRLDNDVVPARRVGMRAVLIALGVSQKRWEPRDAWGLQLKQILERLPHPRWDALPPMERPAALVRDWGQLPQALDLAWASEA